ncbi:acetoacetate-CoA ligase [Rubrobacter radiotolerans]|uniref:Acetoacetate--CoA ligase n=1 Tax=Rubrobacter radiotolerans TaxID=42256 RepID=A0A023X114_RUBRA|nr:acetoacetate--CoA ligase [Rubrobacter radiotolerans]AHY45901.1 acetoacetate-CoA ligase [Rubrobacter radiotolerans]MDX5893315.1 acetoacetate--CoA ligase [Rubrobacter radiotolerans]SMC03489.1 acetoacetyl-CoA synthetase [Rubrobacter radiotolerans DSM 5868]
MTDAADGRGSEAKLLWEPSEEFRESSKMADYMRWLGREKGRSFGDYRSLWEWSVEDLEGFWESVWEFCRVESHAPYRAVLGAREMPGAEWFPGAEVNYAEHILRHAREEPEKGALLARSETRDGLEEVSWGELEGRVAAFAAGLRELGVERGDRVVGYLPNVPEAIVAFLATASLGAVWSACSPDFGAGSVVDRFAQIEPKVLVCVDGYRYGGRDFDRMEVVRRLQGEIPTLEKTVLLPYLDPDADPNALDNAMLWSELADGREGAKLRFEAVPFDHPLWVLYSSGTTGLPKAIVQGHGGILVEHLKAVVIHMDAGPEDRFFWFTTTGWMMWNIVVGSLLSGGTALLYDGNPGYPDLGALWRFAEETQMTVFGTSASYLVSCMKAGLKPAEEYDLSRLKALGSTGSPLPPEGFDWVYDAVAGEKRDFWLFSTSGGTDLCTAFVGGVPLLPVRSGELQAPSLGAKVRSFDEEGRHHYNRVGELVITEPMPSMPLFLWNDETGEKYRDSYFGLYPGVWRHGDWIEIHDDLSCVIYGRSDSTINRGGVRMGTSEIYSAVESVPEVADSLVIDLHKPDGSAFMPLFVVLREGAELDEGLERKIKAEIRDRCSPRHTPDRILAVEEVPRTLNGKKLEVPIKKILSGEPPEKAASRDSLANPEALDRYAELAGKL